MNGLKVFKGPRDPVPRVKGSCNKGKVPSFYEDTSDQHPTVRYLPQRVELGPLGD